MTARLSRRLLIAGTGSGVGKTTVTLGLMAALRGMGLAVQGFKCGPDYIDPTYHTAVTGRPSRNLDSWMTSGETVCEIFARASVDADFSVIEGVMGFYDGRDAKSNEGSSAHIAMLLKCPVLLVINGQSMARSAAAIVKGFQLFEPGVNIVGVFANRLGSENHASLIRDAVEGECGIPLLGYLTRDEGFAIPERHLGLVPSVERGELDGLFAVLGERICAATDLERLLTLAAAPTIAAPIGGLFTPATAHPVIAASHVNDRHPASGHPARVRIALARDAAFHFYYPENLQLLELAGAEIVPFSPLDGEPLPAYVRGLYLGGGFPEEFADRLASHVQARRSLREAIRRGLPTVAECGGFMYLTDEIVTTDGSRYPMLGLIPGRVQMQTKLAALGYRDVRGQPGNFLLPEGETARGHEFHYSIFHPTESLPPAYESTGLRGMKPEGAMVANIVAGYTHLHFASHPKLAERFVSQCRIRARL